MRTTISIGDLEQDAAAIVDEIEGSSEPIFVLQPDQPPAVLISIIRYKEIEKGLTLLNKMRRGD